MCAIHLLGLLTRLSRHAEIEVWNIDNRPARRRHWGIGSGTENKSLRLNNIARASGEDIVGNKNGNHVHFSFFGIGI